MHIPILVAELILLAGIFCQLVVILISRNPENFVTDYPPDICEVYYRTHKRKKEKLTRTAVLTILFYIIWVAAFDTFVIDWIFFPRIRKWRLPGTEDMDKEYAQKWFHLKEALKAAPIAILYALFCGLIFMLIW